MKKQMNYANRRNIPFVILVGGEELKTETFTIKDMNKGSQESITFNELLKKVN